MGHIAVGIDWNVVATIAAPVVALVAGVFINRWFESRPKLISYFGHVSTHQMNPPNAQGFRVFTHEVVIRNVGRVPATNVRVQHATLPDFHVFPPVQHHVDRTPGGSTDIVIPSIVRNEQVVISYLYFPPLTAAQVNTGIKSDQGFATQIPVLLQRVFPMWFQRIVICLLVLGVVTTAYLSYEGITWLTHRLA